MNWEALAVVLTALLAGLGGLIVAVATSRNSIQKAQLEAVQSIIGTLQGQVKTALAQQRAIEEENTALHETAAKIRADYLQLKVEFETLRAENLRLRGEVEQYRSENRTLRGQVEKQAGEIISLQDANEALLAEVAALKAEIVTLKENQSGTNLLSPSRPASSG